MKRMLEVELHRVRQKMTSQCTSTCTLGLLQAIGRMLTNERTNQQTRRIAIPPRGINNALAEEARSKFRGTAFLIISHNSPGLMEKK